MANFVDSTQINLTINARQARTVLDTLGKQAVEVRKKMEAAAAAGDTKKAAQLAKKLKELEKIIEQSKTETLKLEQTMRRLDKASPKELRKALSTLQRQLNTLERGTAAWDAHVEKIRRVREELGRLNSAMDGGQSRWQRFNSWLNNTQTALMGAAAAVAGLVIASKKAVNAYAEMEQEMANVRKFTGMTGEEVEALNEEFRKINTRSPREELNKLAQEAGRLGKTSQEDVLGFVRAADKINVALDDLGDGATLTISKLTGIFGDEERLGTEKALLSVGSVINELSQNCSASAPYLAEFSSRLGGVGAQAGMTIQQIMGFAAVLDSNNQKVEASSTALSQVIVRIYQEPAKYAKVAGLEVGKFTALVKKDMNEALLTFLTALKNAGNMDVLSPMFKDMGENGSRAIAALSTLAGHIDEVKAQQREANKAFREATSIDKEFDVQNNTVQAGLEKAKNSVNELAVELGEKLQPVMRYAISSSTIILRLLNTTISFISANAREIIALGVAFAGYTIAVNASVIATKAAALWTAACTLATTKATAAVGLLKIAWAAAANTVQYFTNGLQVNYAMQLRWRTACLAMQAASPVGMFLTLTAAGLALGRALMSLLPTTDKIKEAYDTMSKIRTDAAVKLEKERQKIYELISAAEDETKSLEERQAAVESLNKIIPDYNASIDETTGKYRASKEALDEYIKSLKLKYELEGAKSQLSEVAGERAGYVVERQQLQDDLTRIQKQRIRQTQTYSSSPGSNISTSGAAPSIANILISSSSEESSLKLRISKLDDKIKIADEKQNAIIKAFGADRLFADDNPEPSGNTPGGNFESGGSYEGGSGKSTSKGEDPFRKRLQQIEEERDKYIEEATSLNAIGFTNWQQYLDAKHEAQLKFYDDTSKAYEEFQKTEDAGYAKNLRARAQEERDWAARLQANSIEDARRKAQVEEAELRQRYAGKRQLSFSEEMQMQDELFDIKYKLLQRELELTGSGSEDYEKKKIAVEDALSRQVLHKRQRLAQEAARIESEYMAKTAAEKLRDELQIIETLRNSGAITRGQQEELTGKAKNKLLKQEKPKTPQQKARSEFDRQKKQLDEMLELELITQKEYADRVKDLQSDLNRAIIEGIGNSGSEWVGQLTSMYQAWADFSEALKDPDGSPFDALAKGLQATAAVMGAVMQSVTALTNAELELQIQAVERRYDREAAFAEGNSYLQRRLEKKKEKEIAKMKSDAAKKNFAMQVAMTVASTAANAVSAYGAALQVGGLAGIILAPIAAAMALAQGAVQIAVLKKQQQAAAQGYSEGGFTRKGRKDEPAGIVHAGEWVASQKLVNNPRTRPVIDMLEYAQRNNTVARLSMDDVSRSISAPAALAWNRQPATVIVREQAPQPEQGDSRLGETLDRLAERLDQPFITVNTVDGPHGMKQANEEYDRLIRNKSK